jgi:hypothetical protein
VVATREGLKVWMLPDLVVQFVKRRSLTIERAMDILKAIRLFALIRTIYQLCLCVGLCVQLRFGHELGHLIINGSLQNEVK